MNQLKRRKTRANSRERGQALLEYALAVLVMIFLFRIMDHQIRAGIGRMWLYMAQNIAAGCPVPEPGKGCSDSVPPEIR